MVQFKALLVFHCAMSLLSETLCASSEAGDNVTIWCEFDENLTHTIFWFKHTSDSVPLLIGCKRFRASAPSEPCKFFTANERIVMNVYKKNTSLTITAVTVSDSGLYYCGYGEEKIFPKLSNSTSLHVKDNNKQNSVDKVSGTNVCENKATGTNINLFENKTTGANINHFENKTKDTNITFSWDKATNCVSPPVLVMLTVLFGSLTVGFGALTVILLSVLIFIMLNHRKTHTDAKAEDNENGDLIVQSSNKKNKRHNEKVDTHVVYSPGGWQ